VVLWCCGRGELNLLLDLQQFRRVVNTSCTSFVSSPQLHLTHSLTHHYNTLSRVEIARVLDRAQVSLLLPTRTVLHPNSKHPLPPTA